MGKVFRNDGFCLVKVGGIVSVSLGQCTAVLQG